MNQGRTKKERQGEKEVAPASSLSTPSVSKTPVHVLAWAFAGAILLWAAFPPVDFWLLGWLAPACWIPLILQPQPLGRKGYAWIWLAGFVHWLLMIQGIRTAHPALYAGWIALAAYLGVYLPLFVGLSRVGVQQLRLPPVLVAPVVWVATEIARGYFLNGFSMGLLAHTQVRWVILLQIADLAGGYTLSALIVLVAAAVGENFVQRNWKPLLVAGLLVIASLVYGQFRLSEAKQLALANHQPPLRVAIIQGSLDTEFDATEAAYLKRLDRTIKQYEALTREALASGKPLDLVIWPESSLPIAELQIQEPLVPPASANLTPEQFRLRIEEANRDFQQLVKSALQLLNQSDKGEQTHLLFGGTSLVYGSAKNHAYRSYNAAFLADPQGTIVNRYYKVLTVMFGEYIPLGEWFPWIYRLTPLGEGLTSGARPVAMQVSGWNIAPNICFESTAPHLIRQQVCQLRQEQQRPDLLVNLSNDGWFHGTALLDQHLRCNIFRALENRTPYLVAANTGFSAHINGSGEVWAQGPRRQTAVLLVEVAKEGRLPPYHIWGDAPAFACLILSGVLAIFGFRRRTNS